MANNRMALICGVCNEAIAIAKYYPSTGWYFTENDHQRDLWINHHWRQCGRETRYGHEAFRLGYESDGMEDWHYVGDPENLWSDVAKQRDHTLKVLNESLARQKKEGS